jgi:hypothetical protein
MIAFNSVCVEIRLDSDLSGQSSLMILIREQFFDYRLSFRREHACEVQSKQVHDPGNAAQGIGDQFDRAERDLD